MKKNYLLLLILFLPFYIYSQNLVSISPAAATAGRQEMDITITASGTHFTQGDGTTVDYGFSPGTFLHTFTLVNDSLLVSKVSIPANTPTGDYQVTVYNSIDDTLTTSFHVTGRPLPLVASINPDTVNAGQTLNVTVIARNARFKNDSTFAFFRTIPLETVINSVNIVNDTLLVANITLPTNIYTGNYNCVLYTPDDGTFIDTSGFHVQGVTPPSLTSISPSTGNPGETLTVSIQGDHTQFTPNQTVVRFDFNPGDPLIADSVNVISQTLLEATFTIPPTTIAGNYTASVTIVEKDSAGTSQVGNGNIPFNVKAIPPFFQSISPSSGKQGETLTVTINGKHTHFIQNQTVVHFGFDSAGTAVNSVNVLNDTILEVTITIPLNTLEGFYAVSVTDPIDGTIVKTDSFYVNFTRKLISISPAAGIAGRQNINVAITAVGTHFTQGNGTTVDFAFSPGTFLNSFYLINDTSLVANISIPANTPTGDYRVTVYNSIDDTLLTSFHVTGRPLPMLISINPASANTGETLDVTVTGKNTHFKKDSTAIYFRTYPGEIIVNSINVLNDTVFIASITLESTIYSGHYDFLLYTMDDGEIGCPGGFQVNGVTPPSLTLSPSNGNAGDTLVVTITGERIHFIQNKTSVGFHFKQGDPVFPDFVNVTSDTTLEVTLMIPRETLTGSYTVHINVDNDSLSEGVQQKNAFHVKALPASLDSIYPAHGRYGQTLTVTIKGKHTHFVQDQTDVHFGFDSTGTAVHSVNVINDTLLEVNLTIPVKTKGRNYTVSVTNSIDGTLYKKDAFNVEEEITFAPSEGYPSQTLDLIFTGVNLFSVNANSIKVWFTLNSSSSTIVVNLITILNDSSFKANITIPANQTPGKYDVSLGIVDSGILVEQKFYVKKTDCMAGYTTTYDLANNTFTLTLDSATSQAAGFHWDFGDGSTSSAKLPSHTFAKDTLYNVCLTVKTVAGDSCSYCHVIGKDSLGNPVRMKGFYAQVVPFKPVVTTVSAIVNSEPGVMLYPNPANHTLTVKPLVSSNAISNIAVLTVYSIEGRLLIQQSSNIKDNAEINISELAEGIYILQIKTDTKSETLKFMKEE